MISTYEIRAQLPSEKGSKTFSLPIAQIEAETHQEAAEQFFGFMEKALLEGPFIPNNSDTFNVAVVGGDDAEVQVFEVAVKVKVDYTQTVTKLEGFEADPIQPLDLNDPNAGLPQAVKDALAQSDEDWETP